MEAYTVFIAAGDGAARERLREAITSAGLTIKGEAEGRDDLDARLAESAPDVLVVDSALLPGDGEPPFGAGRWTGPVLVLVDTDGGQDLRERIARSGAFATLPATVTGEAAAAAIDLAVRRFRELAGCQESLDKLQTRLADRIVIERAKGLLMQAEGLTEEEAFKRIHFDARKRNRTMRSVAEEVLGTGAAEQGVAAAA
jgi:response regulator NasT